MGRAHRIGAGLLAVALLASGCYGPFHLTRRLHQWNGQVGDKWAKEFVFLVLAWLPIYGVATLGDAIVFNSIEFWTGENPVAPEVAARHRKTSSDSSSPQTRRIVRNDAEAILTHRTGPDGQQLIIEQFQHGRAAESLHVQQQGGVTVATNAKGDTLFIAQTLPDGSVLVTDSSGKQVSSYPAQEVERLTASVSK
ncbi:MAG: DUF3332 family protein [Candidatus Omnitrophica bacterium]|nr:DUF3332 family protein [Candidatus Omnitrophota bacterium]